MSQYEKLIVVKLTRIQPALKAIRHFMKRAIFLAALFCLGLAVSAQTLPQIKLQPVFPKLTDERPVWMSEAPDGSGRLFVVYQAGKILVVKKGSDGGDAKEFFNIEDPRPESRRRK